MTGKGRRPDMSTIRCTNRVLLQVYNIKMQHISWEAINVQLGRWFVDQRADTFRSLTVIEQVVRDVTQLQPVDRAIFYDTLVDLKFVGTFCEAAGLRRPDLLVLFTELPALSEEMLSKGPLLELWAFSTKGKV